MFKSKWQKKYEALVTAIKDEIEVNQKLAHRYDVLVIEMYNKQLYFDHCWYCSAGCARQDVSIELNRILKSMGEKES